MRDLRDQMHDLKGRLSVLRDRARDDTMKRRSLQSLRTPSPFTAAEQWYSSDKGYKVDPLTADAGTSPTWKPELSGQLDGLLSPNTVSSAHEIRKGAPEDEDSDVTSVYEDIPDGHHFSSVPQRAYNPPVDTEPSPVSSPILSPKVIENEDSIEEDNIEEENYDDEIVSVDEVDDYESDSTNYHDTTDIPISHEDREDAFDYEHFFLHSAMGTIGQGMRGRNGSFSSEDSVETTLTGSRGSGGSTGSILTSDSMTLVDRQGEERLQTSPVHMLAKDDQILVERLVASLGKCVLGLQEAEIGTYEARVWRRRLDAARRVLEGQEGAV
ncbi:hypothetical protein M7I_1481 [Glarea lozoyensis 74030]|uniref:Uncharacterized protein n=1 Tax=Glarea lozoyensis (strain ATCC 74030 / MF5533) TaxID=1104152 RepID=H0EG71_GLAL7|nr:hypothetical protein M7I_1481 [Glarea lozoyensis 74030]